MNKWPLRVRFGGLGGQGLVTLGAVLADAGAKAGLNVAASQSYGSQARGGATRADVILSQEEIDFPHVHEADLLIVLAQEAYDLFAPEVAAGGVILGDDFFVKPIARSGLRQILLPGTRSAIEEVKNQVAANFVMFGAALGFSRLLGPAPVEQAMGELVSERFIAVNLQAFHLGYAMGEQLVRAEGPWLR